MSRQALFCLMHYTTKCGCAHEKRKEDVGYIYENLEEKIDTKSDEKYVSTVNSWERYISKMDSWKHEEENEKDVETSSSDDDAQIQKRKSKYKKEREGKKWEGRKH